jgi:hypothetical protein
MIYAEVIHLLWFFFLVKSHEWNFSYGLEMVQLTHSQYMI